MPSISGMREVLSRLQEARVAVLQDRCVLVRNRNAGCLQCAQACPSGCISFDGDRINVDPMLCIGCGTCATACPSGALAACNPHDDDILVACRDAAAICEGNVCIGCARVLDAAAGLFDKRSVVRVECLGRVDESLLTALAAQDASSVVLVHGICGECDRMNGRHMLDQVLASEREILMAWNHALDIRAGGKLPAWTRAADEGFDRSRRDLLAHGRTEGLRLGAIVADTALHESAGTLASGADDREAADELDGAAGAMEAPWRTYAKVEKDGTLPHAVPERRMLLLDAMAALGDPLDEMISTRLWGHVIIDTESCSSCRMCATFCPSGALVGFDAEDGSFGVSHYPGLCVKCRCCQHICPKGAIDISEEVFAVDMLAGEVERYIMRPRAVDHRQQHAMLGAMRAIMQAPQVYEVGD